VSSVGTLIEKYTRLLSEVSQSKSLSLEQFILLIPDAVYVVSTLLPLVSSILHSKFGKEISEFALLEQTLLDLRRSICETFSKDKAGDFVGDFLVFDQREYKEKKAAEKLEKVYPADKIMNGVRELIRFSKELENPQVKKALISSFGNRIVLCLTENQVWTAADGALSYGTPGFIQFLIDVEFFAVSLQDCTTPATRKTLSALIARTHQQFTERSAQPIPSVEWFDKRGRDLTTLFEKKSGAILH